MQVDKILHLEIGPLVEEGVKMVTEEITTIGTITGQIREIDLEADGITIGQVIGVVIIQITTEECNTRPNYRHNPQWTFRNRSQGRNRNENYDTRGGSRDRNNRRREESRSWSNSRVSTNHDHVRCYRCQEYNYFVAECPNTPTDEETDYEGADPASLQMMSQNYSPDYSAREADCLNL